MDCNLLLTVPWWLMLFYCVSTLTQSQKLNSQDSKEANFRAPVGTYGMIQPRLYPGKQQQQEIPILEIIEHPRLVEVKCHPETIEIVVKADMFNTGLKIDGGHLRLGLNSLNLNSECRGVPTGEDQISIMASLSNCGTRLSSTEEKIIYSNDLIYSPEPLDGLLRLDAVTVPVECHYDKRYSLDGISLQPTWVPHISTTTVDDQMDFSLQLMDGDWQFERESYLYFLADPINFEVSLGLGHHMPLRLYIDKCVATPSPDTEASLKYEFIENHGCLADAYLTNSNARFLPRKEDHKLRFQLEAFRFYQEPSSQIYITCYIKAVPIPQAVTPHNRACSYIDNRWQSADGADQVCRSCDAFRRVQEPRASKPPKNAVNTKDWSSLILPKSISYNEAKHEPASFIRFRPGSYQNQQVREASNWFRKRNALHEANQALQVGPLVVLPSRGFAGGVSNQAIQSQKSRKL